ncbi:hypothetical protein B0T10DRAFT_485197 [Thelonectria olida]|uniref:Uncharacterized protein n=1 Tax=Thelonectria olida TaxID=1576542 RepID=A0A9P9ATS0_9HYPO|nr:hypothetical protein B0T10DRAFT_485197 [Thelonectria olida]
MPIIFAFIVGRAVKTIAHWRLQQGERVGRLDLLYGSTTVIGTISTMFDIGECGLVAIFLVLTWALSPLGAQSALRVLSFRESKQYSFQNMSYFNLNTSFPERFVGGDLRASGLPVNALVLSSLGAPNTTKQSSLDTWGNVKVPILELLPGYKGEQSTDWISVHKTTNSSTNVTFSSHLGIPVASIPENGNSTFTLETSYLNLDCDGLQQIPMKNMSEKMDSLEARLSNCEGTSKISMCGATMSWGEIATDAYPAGWTNGSSPDRCDDPNPQAREMYYVGYDADWNGTYAKCSLTTTYVEMQVECVGYECVSKAMRPSTQPHSSTNRTIFDGACKDTKYIFAYFTQVLDTLVPSGGSPAASLLQAYLADPDDALSAVSLMKDNVDGAWTVEKSLFSLRMAQMLNTYWLAVVATEALFMGHAPDYETLTSGVTLGDHAILTSGTNGTIYTPVTRVHCDFGWLVPLVLSTIIMLCAAILTMVVDVELRVPKMLMNMTTLTRGNPRDFNLLPGGGGLQDEARGRVIRNVRVRFGVMEGHDQGDYRTGVCYEDGGTVSMVGSRPPMVLQAHEEDRPSRSSSRDT